MKIIMILTLLILGYLALGTDGRECPAKPSPFPRYPLSTSHMCRCFNRPNDTIPVKFKVPPPPEYKIEVIPFDPDFIIDDPRAKTSVCVGFSQQQVPVTYTTFEVVMQAVNEHGWPVGWWDTGPYHDMCVPPFPLTRWFLYDLHLYQEKNVCYNNDTLAKKQKYYTEGSKADAFVEKPRLFQFTNYIKGSHGLNVIFSFNSDANNPPRPEKIRFVAETYYQTDPSTADDFISTRILSPSYTVTYPTTADGSVTLTPSGPPEIDVSLDYAYQTSQKNQSGCLKKPPAPPPIPRYSENTCKCFINARKNHSENSDRHLRLNLTENITELNLNLPDVIPGELLTALEMANKMIDEGRTPSSKSLLEVIPLPATGPIKRVVIIYPFIPVYKTRVYREREVVFQDLRADTGFPTGTWLNPHIEPQKSDYEKTCNEAMIKKFGLQQGKGKSNETGWIQPLYPAVGQCVKHPWHKDGDFIQPSYFHFMLDWFFVECVEKCEKPKFICAVWDYNTQKATHPDPAIPFEFQFMATTVYYKNERPPQKAYVELENVTILTCKAQDPSISGTDVRPWNLMETHLSNFGVSHRSDLWKYTGKDRKLFKRVDDSSDDSDSIQHPDYYKQVHSKRKQECISPATYFAETKDNNLCLCTFWSKNLVTWQTHYGRMKSCNPDKPNFFTDMFEVIIHDEDAYQSATDISVKVGIKDGFKLKDEGLVIHAIYIQAMDEFGLPVGSFSQGHWIPRSTDTICKNIYPRSSSDLALKRHPIFGTKPCPEFSGKDLAIANKWIGTRRTKLGNVFVLKNQWKDLRYDHVCARFGIRVGDFPKATRLQFLAFVRIEDYPGGTNAYRVELRSKWLNAADLRQLSDFNNHVLGQDPLNKDVPLNYQYFRSLLVNEKGFYQRESDAKCTEALTTPIRYFDLCRHYVTSPTTAQDRRFDLHLMIDEYNQYCVQYVSAIKHFSETHPLTLAVADKLKKSIERRDIAIAWKKCFEFKAFKHKVKNSFHVMIRYEANTKVGGYKHCWIFSPLTIKEIAIMAVNDEGYPVGVPYESPDGYGGTRGSFMLFNHHKFYGSGDNILRNEFCYNDTIQLTLDDEIYEDRMIHTGERARCYWSPEGIYGPDPDHFMMNFHTDAESPSLLIWANFNKDKKGFCAHWTFPEKSDKPDVKPPTVIQFIAEVQIGHGTIRKWHPTKSVIGTSLIPKGIIILRSPKYKFHYSHVGKNGNPVDGDFPSKNCHEIEAEVVELHRPNDNCKCTLTPITSDMNTTPEPQVGRKKRQTQSEDEKPGDSVLLSGAAEGRAGSSNDSTENLGPHGLCMQTYKIYDIQLDSVLYRTCLAQEEEKPTLADLAPDDCMTKIDYPSPPEVFPSELIYLRPDGPDPTIPNATLDLIDPTGEAFEGCGYIKDCISRFHIPSIEETCLRDKSCDMIVTFGKALAESPIGHESIIEIYAVTRGWAAIGFSDDEVMSEDYVIECTKEGGEVNLYNSWNLKADPNSTERFNMRLRGEYSARRNIRSVKNIFFEDKLYCKFYIEEWFTKVDPVELTEHHYDLHKEYSILMAFSNELPEPYGEIEGNIKTHMINGAVSERNRTVKKKIQPSRRYSPLPVQVVLFRLHAFLSLLGWLTCLTLANFVARYYKETLVKTFYFKRLNFWYFWHIFGVVMGLLCLIFGEVFRYFAKSHWINKFKSNFHKYTGYTCLGMYVFALLTGLCSKTKRNAGQRKNIINFIHCVVGHVVYNLAILNMSVAARIPYSFLACAYTVYIWVWVILYIIIHAIMTYHYWWIDFILGRRISSRRYFAIDVLAEPVSSDEEEELTRRSLLKRRKTARLSRKSMFSHGRTSLKVAPNDATVEDGDKRVKYVIREAPGTWVRIFFLNAFAIFVCIYTYWVSRKIVGYPTHCYSFEELKEFEHNGIFNRD